MRIAARLAVQRPAEDERGAPREAVAVRATMRSLGYHGIDVVVRNISPTGFMAEADGEYAPGSYVRLRLPAIGALHARIVWAERGQVGAAFVNPVDPGRLKRIVGLSRVMAG